MMSALTKFAVCLIMVFASTSTARGDGDTTPGKNSVYVSNSGVVFESFAQVATGTIIKGKKKRVLEVDATLVLVSDNADFAGLRASVNGITLEPASSFQTSSCDGFTVLNCTFSAHWWLDLDAAEAANPGEIVKNPLVILIEAATTGPTATANASLRARIIKK